MIGPLVLLALAGLAFLAIAGGALPLPALAAPGEASPWRPMPRAATGTLYERHGRWHAQITVGPKVRRSFLLATCTNERQASARRDLLARLAADLRAAGTPLDTAERLLRLAAERDGAALRDVEAFAGALARGEARPKAAPSAKGPTFCDVAKRWTSGELARAYPDHVKVKSSAERDRQRLERYVYPLAGDVPIVDFTLEHAEAIMAALPSNRVRTPATRRHVGQLLHRVLALAVYPLKLIKANPLPKGFLPKVGKGKAKGWLYPSEDARLLGCAAVPLCRRVLYGALHREGPRLSEAGALDVADVDLRIGVVNLDENKTDDPRTWPLSRDVAAALRAWLTWRTSHGETIGPRSPLFVAEEGARIGTGNENNAARFREDLKLAGIDRPELFERTAARMHIRLHDTRATFVTLSLANGRTETWVADRTGHRSSDMINKYRRAARTAAELNLGPLGPMDELIPELHQKGDDGGGEPPRKRRRETQTDRPGRRKTAVPAHGFEP